MTYETHTIETGYWRAKDNGFDSMYIECGMNDEGAEIGYAVRNSAGEPMVYRDREAAQEYVDFLQECAKVF